MNLIISEEIKDRINLNDSSNIVCNEVNEINITNQKIFLHLVFENKKIKKNIILENFKINKDVYNFNRPLCFKLESVKKINNKLIAKIFIDENIFWEGVDNE